MAYLTSFWDFMGYIRKRSHEFTSDNTMQLIEKLFIAKNKGKTLDGVIQIFNLFNIRNADLEQALLSEKESIKQIDFILPLVLYSINQWDKT